MSKMIALIALTLVSFNVNAQFFPIEPHTPPTPPTLVPMIPSPIQQQPPPPPPPQRSPNEPTAPIGADLPPGSLATDLTLTCIAPRPNTTFMVFTENQTVTVEIFHHNGVEYMPIHLGQVVPQDLPILASRAAVLKRLGSYGRFDFPLSGCKTYGGQLFRCVDFKSQTTELNGHRVRPIALYTATHSVQSFIGPENYTEITLQLEVDGKNLFESMSYTPTECTNRRRPI